VSHKKIFLADDSITIQKVVELTFSEGDYEVHCVASGAQAMSRITEIRPDIVLLDVTMPERSGYDICAELTKSPDLSRIPVLLLTGALEPFDERRAREAGAKGHLTKPFESRALVSRVEELIEQGRGSGTAPTAPVRPAMGTRQAAETRPVVERPAPRRPDPPPAPAAAPPPVTRPVSAPPSAAVKKEPGIPPEVLDRAVREAIRGISESVIREVAWQVIPDLAEAIIRRRIRELEEEAVARQ
jgi:CheY-like chemotaxis protein